MAGGARHAQGFAAGTGHARGFDRLLERGIHQSGGSGANTLDGDTARTPCGNLSGHAAQARFQAVDHTDVIVTNLEQHFGMSRDDTGRAGIERDEPGGPYRARSAQLGEAIVDPDTKPRQRQAGVLAKVHSRGAGVILLAGKSDPVLPDSDDGGDDADLEIAALQRLALLDMRLEITDMPPGRVIDARTSGETDLAQGVAHASIVVAVARGVDIGFGGGADVRPAAEETAEMSFFVAPSRDFDGAVGIVVGIDDAGGFEGIDHAKRSIEPAREILALEVRAGQQLWSRSCAGAEHIADAVDFGAEPGLRQPLRQPLQRVHMRWRECRLVNAALVSADVAQRMEISEHAGAVEMRTGVRHEVQPRSRLDWQ